MNIQKVQLSELTADPKNTRRHDRRNIDTIKESLKKFGQYRPFVVQKSGMVIRIGNGMYEAMKELGWQEGHALVKDLSDEESETLSILDNRSSELAEWDEAMLSQVLGTLPEDLLTLTGFNQSEIDELASTDVTGELKDGFTEGGKTSDDLSDTMFSFGQYRFPVERDKYLLWQEALRQKVGFDNKSALEEIKRRIGL
jgi:hypothetical protein